MEKGVYVLAIIFIVLSMSLVVGETIITNTVVNSTNANLEGNLTLGQKISFALGEVIDNLVNGWIKINGGLNVTDNITASYFIGDGSQLTGISGVNSSWNESRAYELFLNRTSESSYLSTYNSTYNNKASYQFLNNNFNGSGSFTTTGNGSFYGMDIAQVEIWVKSGNTIQSTIDSITDASQSKPYLIRIPPGVYDEQVTMKPYISLKGAGWESTKITQSPGTLIPTLIPANQTEVSDVYIYAGSSGQCVGTNKNLEVNNSKYSLKNIYFDCKWDIVVETNPGNTIYIKDSYAITHYDGFLLNSLAGGSTMYIDNVDVIAKASILAMLGAFKVSTNSSSQMYVRDSTVRGSFSNSHASGVAIARSFGGNLTMYNVHIDVKNSGSADTHGIMSSYESSANVKVYGGSVSVTSSATYSDLFQGDGANLEVYGTEYETSIGTIGGNFRFPNNLTVDGIMQTLPRSTATCSSASEGGIYYDSDDNHFYGCNSTDWIQLDN